MTVKDLIKVRSKDDCVCDIATDAYIYDSYLFDDSTHGNVDYNVDDNVLDMTVSEFGTVDQFCPVIYVDTCTV